MMRTGNVQRLVDNWLDPSESKPPLLLSGWSQEDLIKMQTSIVEKINEADVWMVRTDSKNITIESVREMVSQATRTPWGNIKLLIIPKAELLNSNAANILLKPLEEAPQFARYLLLTKFKRRILSTISSRCIHLNLGLPISDSSQRESKLLSESILRRLASARDTLDDDELLAIEDGLEDMLRKFGPTPELRRAYCRLRDYHIITSTRGANAGIASDVLVTNLPVGRD